MKSAEKIECATYRFGLDNDFYRNRPLDKSQYAYYDVDDCAPRHIGDAALFQGAVWYVSQSSAWVDSRRSVLMFTHRLAGANYNKAQLEFNPAFRGRSLNGKVIERQAEKLRVHLDIDEEQSIGDAYFYSWLPESGNIMYNMPPLGTSVSLYMQNADEHSAACVRNVRENGSACAFTQDQNNRYLTTEPQKSLAMKPETMELAAIESGDAALIDDNFGCRISSAKEVQIQARGRISVHGAKVDMQAPKEMTFARCDLGEPTVMNLCHNVDASGGKGRFKATEIDHYPQNGRGELTSSENGAGEAGEKAEQERQKRMKFQLAKLIKQSEFEPKYDITDIYQTALSAVPLRSADDDLSRLSAGSRVLFGNMEDYMHVAISEKRRHWEKPGNQAAKAAISTGRIKGNSERDAENRSPKRNSFQKR
jgi:hypothetical protein